jgi:hypothetical protein
MTALYPEAFNFFGVNSGDIEFFDFDNDADLDILITGSGQGGRAAKIYQNMDGEYCEYTAITLAGVSDSSTAIGDYDNDGDLDILLTGTDNSSTDISKLYQNTGGNFSEYTNANLTPVSGGTADFADYDNDGDLDIFLTGGANITKVYQNTDGNFSEYTHINLPGISKSSVVFGDYDNDGDLDIIMAGNTGSEKIAKVFKNTGDNFTEYTQISLEGVEYCDLVLGDYDNDGDLDLLLTGFNASFAHVAKLYQNTGNDFTEATSITLAAAAVSSTAFGDYDNDGDLDIIITGRSSSYSGMAKVYRNTNGNFTEETRINLTGVQNSALALGDYDNDGDLDIMLSGEIDGVGGITKFYRNNLMGTNTPPSMPANLNADISGQNVVLSWSAASDAETISSAGLNYNIYMGSTPGGIDIVSPMALPLSSGYRMIPSRGSIRSPDRQ